MFYFKGGSKMNRFMRTLRKTKGILAAALALSFVVSGVAPVAPMNTVLAAAHGDKLVLNKNKIKLNGTTTFTAEGKYASYDGLTRDQAHQLNGQFNTPQYSDIKTTIKTKKSTSGKKTKVKFNVTLDQLSDPQIDCGDTALYEEGDWNTYLTMPHLVYTVFDYKTGKSIPQRKK